MPRAPYHQPWITPFSNQQAQGRGYQNQHRPRNNMERRNAPLDPIPMSYNQILQPLIQSLLVDPKPLKSLPQPYPPRYDPDVQCGYHEGSIRHSTEDDKAFKAKVQQLIIKKYIAFREGNLVVNTNLSP